MTTMQKTDFLKYSHSIGLSTMAGRGFYYPVDTAFDDEGKNLHGEPFSRWRQPRAARYDL